MISKTKIENRKKRKTNLELVSTINFAKKNHLIHIAKKLSTPRRKRKEINLDELNLIKGNSILFAGRVLGHGEIRRKINISAIGFSKQAKEKLKKAGCDVKTIKQEIENNPKLSGIEVI
jgi:large subunit ribosomal protein L18e